MPTPFTHLAYAHQVLEDTALPPAFGTLLGKHLPAFLLGSVAADARVDAPDSRAATHFYTYTEPMPDNPWRVMLRQNPILAHPTDEAWRVFVAGYVFHLGMDEYWSRYVLSPHFANGDWGSSLRQRFYVLHLLLISMDERDLSTLPKADDATLRACQPQQWLPFMNDTILCDWRDMIAQQIIGESLTLQIFGGRINQTPEQLRPVLDSTEQMHELLYQHLTPDFLRQTEADMMIFAREQLINYLGNHA